MPDGNLTGSGTRLPWLSRVGRAQQSSMLTYEYPSSWSVLSPIFRVWMKSAIFLMKASLTLQRTAFQLLKPIGGVRARPFSSALAGVGAATRLTTVVARTSTAADEAAITGRSLGMGAPAGDAVLGMACPERRDGHRRC